MKRRALIGAVSASPFLAGCVIDGTRQHELHGRGTMELRIDGDPIDLDADRFQSEHAPNESLDFHFHEDDEYWYMEGEEPVTIADGIDRIPYFEFEASNGEYVLRYDGTTYDTAESDTELVATVDDDGVDPAGYVLQDGDSVSIEISTDN